MKSRLIFFGLLLATFVVYSLPFVSWPFGWLETFFHELSHGLVAVATGGEVVRIELHLRGSGLCVYRGGIRFLISFSGYAGAVLWGGLIYLSALGANRQTAPFLGGFLLVILGVSGLLWARDLITILILLTIMVVFGVQMKFRDTPFLAWFLRFSGLYVAMDAVRSPLHLIDGRSLGDGATLASLTHVPEIVWIGLWEALAIGGIWFLWRVTKEVMSEPAQG